MIRTLVSAFLVFLILTGTGTAAETVRFTSSTNYNGAKLVLRGELHRPRGAGRHPAVILMHGCGGWQKPVLRALRAHARFLVRRGFVVLNLDSFGPRRRDKGWVCTSRTRLSQAQRYRSVDAFDAMKYLMSRKFVDPRNIFLMGQSNGGSVALIVANRRGQHNHGRRVFSGKVPRFRAVIAYYPWCGWNTLGGSQGPHLVTNALVFSGARDGWTPPNACKTAAKRSRKMRVVIYPKAVHSFDLRIPVQRYLGHLVGNDRKATADSRRRMVRFFRQNIVR